MQTKHLKIEYIGFFPRLKAAFIDMFFIILPVNYVLALFFGFDAFKSSEPNPALGISQFILVSLTYAFLNSKLGQTPGKKAIKAKIVDAKTFEKIGFLRSYARFIFYVISFISIIGFFLPFFRKDKRALHDLIARTVVVYEEA